MRAAINNEVELFTDGASPRYIYRNIVADSFLLEPFSSKCVCFTRSTFVYFSMQQVSIFKAVKLVSCLFSSSSASSRFRLLVCSLSVESTEGFDFLF